MTENTLTHDLQELSTDSALLMLSAAKAMAEQLGVRVCISIVGCQGVPLARLRMNGAPLHCVDFADDKAYTAVSFQKPTHFWDERVANQPPDSPQKRVQQALASHPRMLMLGGGVPVRLDPETNSTQLSSTARILGAVGVSGASVEQDIQCAEAAVSVLLNMADR